jgi:GT2 family glycosyltransferase
MDPSTRFTGDAITPVVTELEKGEYVAVGWRGGLINTEDEWRSVDDRGVGEVDVLFSYFMAFNREAMIEVGGFNPRALYYRNADIEYSLKIRQARGRLLQMELPLTQERHHGYHDVDPEFRDLQSKKNYDRILDKYRGKSAILSPRR